MTSTHFIQFNTTHPPAPHLTRRQRLKSLRNLRLQVHLRLPKNLRSHLKFLPPLFNQPGPDDNRVRSHDFLVVVNVGRAVRAVVAVDGFAGVAVVDVGFGVVLNGKYSW